MRFNPKEEEVFKKVSEAQRTEVILRVTVTEE